MALRRHRNSFYVEKISADKAEKMDKEALLALTKELAVELYGSRFSHGGR